MEQLRVIRFRIVEKTPGIHYFYPYFVDTREPLLDEVGEEIECQGEDEVNALVEILRLRHYVVDLEQK